MIFILVDGNKIVRCMATEESNLHSDKLHMSKYFVERKGTVGDEYDTSTDAWTPKPENYPQPSQDEIDEGKIQTEIIEIQRAEAVQSLKGKGDLPPDFVDTGRGRKP